MKLKPYKEILAMTKEKINECLAPIRANKAKKRAELEQIKIDEKVTRIESEIHELAAKEDIDFDAIINKLDEVALLERRKSQFDKIIGELFPSE